RFEVGRQGRPGIAVRHERRLQFARGEGIAVQRRIAFQGECGAGKNDGLPRIRHRRRGRGAGETDGETGDEAGVGSPTDRRPHGSADRRLTDASTSTEKSAPSNTARTTSSELMMPTSLLSSSSTGTWWTRRVAMSCTASMAGSSAYTVVRVGFIRSATVAD